MFHCLLNSAGADGNLAEAADSWARWWKVEIKVNPTQVYEDMGRPVASVPFFHAENFQLVYDVRCRRTIVTSDRNEWGEIIGSLSPVPAVRRYRVSERDSLKF